MFRFFEFTATSLDQHSLQWTLLRLISALNDGTLWTCCEQSYSSFCKSTSILRRCNL